MQQLFIVPLALRRVVVLWLCMALCVGMAQPALAQSPVGNTPAQTTADPISVGLGVQTPAGDGVTAFNGEPITYTINLVNLTNAPISNISVFNPLPEDTLDRLVCTPACGQSVTTRSIPDPLGGVIEVTRTLAVSWTIPTLSPGAGAGVQLQLVGRVIGKMPGVSFSSSAIAIYDGGAVGSNNALVTVAAQPRNTNGARVENAPTWFSADAGGTLDQDWGDVNRDGALDLALASTIGTSVYRNNAGLLTRIWSVPQMSYGVKWADVDNDGVLELVVVGDSDDKTAQSTGRNRVYKYNTASGNLGLMSEFTSTRQLVRVAVGDLNGDGFIDVIGSTNAIAVDCAVPVFLNNGAGQFAYSPSRCLTTSATAAISLGDMNNDDKLDLAMGAFPNDIQIRVNGTITSLISGTQSIPIESGLSFLPYDFSWGDYDDDGFLDLAMAFPLDRQARVYRNVAGPNGTRIFVLQQILPNLTFLTPFAIDWADIDGDGALDLTVSGSPALVYVRNTAGRFVLKADLGANVGGGQVWDARAAQTQADQGFNLVFTNRDSASTMFDVIAPRLSPAIAPAFGTDVLPASHVALADIDNNGFLDMIQGANGATVRSRAFLNIDTTFPGFSTFNTLLGPQRIAVGDFSNDNVLEVAIGDRTQLALYTPNGTLTRNIAVPAPGPYVPAWGDINDDGLLDLFVASSGPVFVYLNTAGVLSSAPVFQTSEECTVASTTESPLRSISVMDVTGDRFMDFVVGCFGQPTRLYRNNQNNTFTLIWSAPASTPTTDVGLDDFNGDGRPDLAVANDGQPIQVYENTGSTFASSPIWNSSANNRTMDVAWGDWDNNGYPELAAATLSGPVEVYANLDSQPGRPQLQRLWRSTLSAPFTSVAWGDLDKDGDLDLVSTGSTAQATGLFINTNNYPYQFNTPGNPVQQVDLPRVTSYVSLSRPGSTPDAFFNSTSQFVTNPNVATVPVTFTVYGPDGSRSNAPAAVPIQGLVYEYSLDGGSTWSKATPLSTTVAITQVTRAGTSGVFLWNARADKAISDNAHFRVRVIAKANAGPVQRASAAAITPPFRLRSTTCFWAESASMVYSPTLPLEKQNITFAGGQVGGSGQITFSWQFGDGKTRIGQLVTHSYTVAGTYVVSLTVTGPACPITRPFTINVPVTVTAGPPVYTVYMPIMANDTTTLRSAMKQQAPAVDLSQQVTGLSGVLEGARLTLAWEAPARAQPDAYRVYRSTAQESRVLLGEVPATQRNYVDESAPCGAAYDVTWLRDGAESLSSATSYYTDPCVVAVKQPAQPARVPRFTLQRTTPAATTPSAAAVLNAPPSLTPQTFVTPPTFKTCDLQTRTVPNPRPSLISINSQPALNAGGTVVAFWSTGNLDPRGLNADGSIELYVAGPTNAVTPVTMTQVTNSSGSILGGFNLWPSVSGDGAKIAFASDRDLTGQNPESNFEVFIARLGPSRSVSLTQISSTPSGVSLVPSLSASGNHVAFVSDGNYAGQNSQRALQVFIATLSDTQPISFFQVTKSPAILLNDLPSISDNGQRVAFVQREFSDVTDVVSQTVMAWRGDINASDFITVDVTATDPRPALSGNGRYVAYVHADAPEGPFMLEVLDLDFPNQPAREIARVVRECKPFISREGNRVGCIDDPSLNIFVYNPNLQLATLGPVVGSNAQPTLASAGDVVAYVDNNDQIAWVVCRSADLALVLPITNSTPARAGQLVTMSVPISNLGPSASPTTTLYYTFTSTNDENIFVAGKTPSTTVTGVVTYVTPIPANSVFTATVPLSTTEFSEIEMDWRVEGAAEDNNPNNNSITSTVIMQADVRFNIALAVTSQPTQNVRAGFPITYTIVMTNIGTSRANGVRITDTLPAETSFVAITSSTTTTGTVSCSEPSAGTPGATVGCELTGSRLPGQSLGVITITLSALVTNTALGPLSNVVSATAIELAGVASRTLTTTVLPQADLQVSAVVSPARPATNDNSVYTVLVTNTGRVTVTDAILSMTLPISTLYVPGSSTPWNVSMAGRVIATGPVLVGAQSTRSLTYTLYISPEVQIGQSLLTTAYITSPLQAANIGSFDPNNANNTFTQTAIANRVSDFSVSLEASPLVIAGQEITYVVVYTNAGPSIADVVTVTVSAPLLEPAQVFTVTSLGVGITGTESFSAVVGGAYITPVLTSTAFITSDNGDNNLVNNSFAATSEVTSSADISVEITSALTSVTAGNRITYTVAFSNSGPSDAVNFVAVFSATGAVSLTAPAGWVKVSDTQISLTLAALAAGAEPTFTITGVVPSFAAPGSFINTRLSASSDTTDPDLTNNSDSDSAQTNASADLRVAVTPMGTAIAGLPFTFTVAYSNTGPSDAINTRVTFTTPTNFPILSAPAGWSISPANVASLSIPAFAPSGPINAAIVVSVAATIPPAFNSVQATINSNTPDPAPGNNSSNPSFNITRSTDLSITVIAANVTDNGLAYNYTVVMTNFGPSVLPSQQFTMTWSRKLKEFTSVSSGWVSSVPNGTNDITAATFTSIPPLFPGASSTAIVSVRMPKKGNSVTAALGVTTPGSTDPNLSNNTTTKFTSLNPVFINAITLTASSSTVVSGTMATFTVTVGPENATLPLTYTWAVLNQGPIPDDVIDGDVVTNETVTRNFTWTVLGPQLVTVIANNGGGPLLASRIITVTPVTVSGVSLDGPATVQIGANAQFTASVSPSSATPPITYSWLASNQAGLPPPPVPGGITNVRALSWNVLGPQVVTVTADNGATVLATRTITVLPVNLISVVISTPVNVQIGGVPFTFTATSSPANATTPITYVWSAVNQSPQTFTGAGLTSTAVFTWGVLGPQWVTVTATNQGNTVTGTFVITVSAIPMTSAAITTPVSTASSGTPFTFTANILPVSSTLPINYTWTATGQSPQVQAGVNALSSTVVFTWSTSGTQVVTVTANNGGSSVIATRTVTVTSVNLTSVGLSTPQLSQPLGSPFTFNASALPANATSPITYTWTATNQGPQTVIGTTSPISRTLAWSVLGPQTVTITAANVGSTVSQSLVITVTPVNLTSVAINAPVTTAPISTVFNFTANALPVNATTPITYVWSASGQSPVTQAGAGLSSAQGFTWTSPGIQVVTVTATNAGNTVTSTTLVTVTAVPLTGVSINTPADTQLVLSTFAFTANVSPLNAGVPITYTWSATGQSTVVQTSTLPSSTQNFNWSVPGPQLVTVIADNGVNAVSATYAVTVTPVAPASVSLSVSPVVNANVALGVSASVSPINVTLPLTYTWEATNQPGPIVKTAVNSAFDSETYAWPVTGTQTITVVVSNGFGAVVTGTAQLEVVP